eukprot:2670779-Ditylum_brightwellii.AAC.1
MLKDQNLTQGLASYVVAKTLLKGDVLTVFKQAEITREGGTKPEALHAEKSSLRQGPDCEGMGSPCTGVEQ